MDKQQNSRTGWGVITGLFASLLIAFSVIIFLDAIDFDLFIDVNAEQVALMWRYSVAVLALLIVIWIVAGGRRGQGFISAFGVLVAGLIGSLPVLFPNGLTVSTVSADPSLLSVDSAIDNEVRSAGDIINEAVSVETDRRSGIWSSNETLNMRTITSEEQARYFKLSVPSRQYFMFEASSPSADFDPNIQIYKIENNDVSDFVTSDDDGGVLPYGARADSVLDPGDYLIILKFEFYGDPVIVDGVDLEFAVHEFDSPYLTSDERFIDNLNISETADDVANSIVGRFERAAYNEYRLNVFGLDVGQPEGARADSCIYVDIIPGEGSDLDTIAAIWDSQRQELVKVNDDAAPGSTVAYQNLYGSQLKFVPAQGSDDSVMQAASEDVGKDRSIAGRLEQINPFRSSDEDQADRTAKAADEMTVPLEQRYFVWVRPIGLLMEAAEYSASAYYVPRENCEANEDVQTQRLQSESQP